jgi:hypothetical protein
MYKKYRIFPAIAMLHIVAAVSVAQAASSVEASSKVNANVLSTAVILQNSKNVEMGDIEKPSFGSSLYAVGALGLSVVYGDGGGAFLGSPQPGEMKIAGPAGLTMSYDLVAKTCNKSGVLIDAILALPPTMLSGGIDLIPVGATLEIFSFASPGPVSCDFELFANY